MRPGRRRLVLRSRFRCHGGSSPITLTRTVKPTCSCASLYELLIAPESGAHASRVASRSPLVGIRDRLVADPLSGLSSTPASCQPCGAVTRRGRAVGGHAVGGRYRGRLTGCGGALARAVRGRDRELDRRPEDGSRQRVFGAGCTGDRRGAAPLASQRSRHVMPVPVHVPVARQHGSHDGIPMIDGACVFGSAADAARTDPATTASATTPTTRTTRPPIQRDLAGELRFGIVPSVAA